VAGGQEPRAEETALKYAMMTMAALSATVSCADAPAAPRATPPTEQPEAAWLRIDGDVGVQLARVGSSFALDIAGTGLRLSGPAAADAVMAVELPRVSLGLSGDGGRVTGVPTAPGVLQVTVVARSARGGRAEAQFPIVVLSADLSAPVLPLVPYAYSDATAPLPHHVSNSPQVRNTDNTPGANPITDGGAALGRVLFYDRRLSGNDQVSCATCHQQQFSFGDTLRQSVGFRGERTARHSMPLANTRFYRPSRFFRDERAATLEQLVLQPVSDPVEMGLPTDLLTSKLRSAPFYAALYAAAFGDTAITLDRTARALAQFVRALQSTNARLDSTIASGVSFTALEAEGSLLFDASGCRSCHEAYVAVSDSARNNGLDAVNVDAGAGRGRFKAPSLRNVAVRPPYMHDGRFRTLDDVIDFYDHGVAPNADLDRTLRNQDGSLRRLQLTPHQKSALKAFLETLTDRTFLTDPRFGNPFRD
jgi:cytochrome c peroxidase